MSVLVVLNILLFANSVHASVKKGVGAWSASLLCDDFKVLNNMSWWYDWQMDLTKFHEKVSNVCPPSTDQSMPPYVPMVKNKHTIINIPRNAQFVLGFNEPDHAHAANMSAQETADAWPEIEKRSHGIPLVSPATAGHFPWLQEFFRLCQGCRIDYLAVHVYSCDAHHVMSYLQKLYHTFHKKIWLTEFACPHSTDENQQLHLMQTLLPQLEAADYVFRYSWFSARRTKTGYVSPVVSLLKDGSSTLTTIGQFYNNFQGNGNNAHVVG